MLGSAWNTSMAHHFANIEVIQKTIQPKWKEIIAFFVHLHVSSIARRYSQLADTNN